MGFRSSAHRRSSQGVRSAEAQERHSGRPVPDEAALEDVPRPQPEHQEDRL